MDQGELLNLEDAARRLGCHVETLRVHIRDGRLRAVRGPHGAYYLAAQEVALYPAPRRGWPAPKEFTEGELEGSWDLVEGILPAARAWRHRELDLMEQLRTNPNGNLSLYRLVSVHRLRRLGLTCDQIGTELGISARHARRLNRASVFLALRRKLVQTDAAKARIEKAAARRLARLNTPIRSQTRRRAHLSGSGVTECAP